MKTALIAAHDAGGAEVISSWVGRQKDTQFRYALAGPAIKIFERKLSVSAQSSVDWKGVDFVVTGTGWSSDHERSFIAAARGRSIPVYSYLDHWSSYRRRFLKADGDPVFPDQLWVGDEFALEIARREVPEVEAVIQGNPYLEEMAERVRSLTSRREDAGLRVLYVTEPTSVAAQKATGDPMGWGYTEFRAIERFAEHLRANGERVEAIRLRPHPSEERGKYDEAIRKLGERFPASVSRESDLAIDCAWADCVAGCDSMAMAVARFAGKKVICCIPPGGKPLTLPFPEIIRI